MSSLPLRRTTAGANPEYCDELYPRPAEYTIGEPVRKIILLTSNGFDDNLAVNLDDAPGAQSSTVTDLADQSDLELVRLPPYSPDGNPVERSCRQREQSLKNRFVDDLDDHKQPIQR